MSSTVLIEALCQHRAWVQHWIADVEAGLKPTPESLVKALSHIEGHIKAALAGTAQERRLSDLSRLLIACGLGDHARPLSPAETFEICLRKIERMSILTSPAYAATHYGARRNISDNEVEAALASWFGDEWPAMGALARSGLVDDMRAALTAAAKVRANSEGDGEVGQGRYLSTDDAETVLFQAIRDIKIGNKTDDKLILENLRKSGVWLARIALQHGKEAPFEAGDRVTLVGVGECVVQQCFDAAGGWRVNAKGPSCAANPKGLYDFPASNVAALGSHQEPNS